MDFKTHFGPKIRRGLPAGYDLNRIEGFQMHQSESIESMLSRLTSGDTTVIGDVYDDDQYPFEDFVDRFDQFDEADRISERFSQATGQENSVSSDSRAPEQPFGNAQGAQDNPGETEISPSSDR